MGASDSKRELPDVVYMVKSDPGTFRRYVSDAKVTEYFHFDQCGCRRGVGYWGCRGDEVDSFREPCADHIHLGHELC